MSDLSSPSWDFRWPDPVASRVASERLLEAMPPDQAGLNHRIMVTIRLETDGDRDVVTSALLATPWAVERIYWKAPMFEGTMPIASAMPLEADETGRVAAKQGVILTLQQRRIPVLTAWEPETGHYLVEVLESPVLEYAHAEAALAAVGVNPLSQPPRHWSQQIQKPVSRRSLITLFR
ncbi:MAG: hypothetical protein HQL58_02015 [Magnetococcales bacterium]|nr:hypothetical protein [Magnetococcales bacterium]